MCGIFGYVGTHEAQPIVLKGMKRLENRGYDNAGLATLHQERLHVRKCSGKISELEKLLASDPVPGLIGIGHTRWLTHGDRNKRNAHPHLGGVIGQPIIALVHNGTIENYERLRQRLIEKGYRFESETDTEVIAHLVASYLHESLAAAVQRASEDLVGSYALAVISPRFPNELVGIRCQTPLLWGRGDESVFLASDESALVGYATEVMDFKDGELCRLQLTNVSVWGQQGASVTTTLRPLTATLTHVTKGDFDHFMRKEIAEQPLVLERILAGRLDESAGSARFQEFSPQQFRGLQRLIITACGTSYYAGKVGKYLFHNLAQLAVETEYASEYCHSNPPLERDALVCVLSQSGETLDTLTALRECKRRGYPTLALCNQESSTMAKEADMVVPLLAGPEIGVASTKAFTAQVTLLTLLALYLARLRHLSLDGGMKIVKQLQRLPDLMRHTLQTEAVVRTVAERYCHVTNALYLGRQYLYPVALEGALKLKEISYIHAEGQPAGEMKHGPIALVDKNTPSVFLVPTGPMRSKVILNLQEIKARGGPIIAVTEEGDTELTGYCDAIMTIPRDVPDYLQPLVAVIPLQLLAYHAALLRNCNVDQPRNLAKSVTVE